MNKTIVLGFLGLFLSLGVFIPNSAFAATGDVSAVRIEPDGWVAEVDVDGFTTGGAYNFGLDSHNSPTSPKLILNVTSSGFDSNGNPTAIQRTVFATQWVRKPYPANTGSGGPGTVKDEVATNGKVTLKVSLSDFVYAGDANVTAAVASGFYTDTGTGGTGLANATTTLAVQNGATLPYPKVVGRWAWPGYERVTGDFPVEATIFDRFPMNTAPVAVVQFTATDQHGHSVVVPSTQVTISSRGGDVNPVQVYAATIPVAGFTPKDVITVNFKAFPWVGDASSTLDSSVGADGVAQPSEQLGPLTEINDSAGTYGVGYALVAPNGATTTAKVYGSEAAAEAAGAATAFPTIGKAAEAIKAYQLANYGRNSAGGGVILLSAGTYGFPGYAPADLGTMDTWLIVRPAAGVAPNQAILTNSGNVVFNAQKLKFDSISVSSTTSGLAKGRVATDVFWIHNSLINSTSSTAFYVYRTLYATQNQITALKQGFTNASTYRAPFALVRGNSAAAYLDADLYTILGNKNIRPKFEETGNVASAAPSDNSVYAYNTLYNVNNLSAATIMTTTNVTQGVAIISNLFEGTTDLRPLLQIAGDSSYSTTTNVMFWHNTAVGQRTNIGYNEFGSVPFPRLNWSQKFNIFRQWNNKDDRFSNPDGGPNANRIGGWPVGYNVGSVGNLIQTSVFPPEFNGVGSFLGGNPNFTRDASTYGTAAGYGDYTLTSGSPAIDIAPLSGAFDQMVPFDLQGKPISGTPDAGAYEYQSAPIVDVTPPVLSNLAPTGTLAVGTTATTLTLTTNEPANCSYATTTGVSYSSMIPFTSTGSVSHANPVNGLSDGQSYAYYVRCQDTSGNTSDEKTISFSVDAPLPPDITPPTVSIMSPADGTTVSATTTLTATSTDDRGVTGVQFKLDGTLLGSELTVSPYTYAWDTTKVSNGIHSLAAVAHDAAGNYATSSAISVSVQNVVATSTGADTQSGMVLHLTFDQADMNGSMANDVSGNGHNGTLLGTTTPSTVTGHMGDALSFNGGNYVDLGTSNFGLTNNYSVSFWMMQTQSGVFYPNIIARGSSFSPFAVRLYGTSPLYTWQVGNRTSAGVTYLHPSQTITKNQWYHAVITYANGVRTFYVNGTQIGGDTLTGTIAWPTTAGNNLVIGKGSPNATSVDGIVGAVDEVRLYNRVLSPADVTALYQDQ